jgi:hypothetical protein
MRELLHSRGRVSVPERAAAPYDDRLRWYVYWY